MLASHSELDAGVAGFTLVEILVTLALVALLATVMMGAMVQIRSVSTISQRNDVITEFEALGEYLDKLISNAKKLPLIQRNPERLLTFDGGPDYIRFVSLIRIGSNQLSLRDVELFGQKNGGALDVVQLSMPRRLNDVTKDQMKRIFKPTLIADLKSVKFEYLGTTSTTVDSQSDWQSSWNVPGSLPRTMRILITADRAGKLVNLERLINLKLAE